MTGSGKVKYLTYFVSERNPKRYVKIRYEDKNLWLTQKQIAQVYGLTAFTVNKHIKTIFSVGKGRLKESDLARKFRINTANGKERTVIHYSLAIVSIIGDSHAHFHFKQVCRFTLWREQVEEEYPIVVKGKSIVNSLCFVSNPNLRIYLMNNEWRFAQYVFRKDEEYDGERFFGLDISKIKDMTDEEVEDCYFDWLEKNELFFEALLRSRKEEIAARKRTEKKYGMPYSEILKLSEIPESHCTGIYDEDFDIVFDENSDEDSQ